MKKGYLLTLVCFLGTALYANVRLPKLFGDNMVLQRNQLIPVWGWADAGEKITVAFNGQSKTIKTGKDGKWMVKLDAVMAGGPFVLNVSGKNTITINNVLVGEVWICSGQSNMEMPIAGWGKIDNYQQEIANADFPQIRQFLVPKTTSSLPQDELPGGDWKVCSKETAGDFTAAGYFFARELIKTLHVPIGLINTSWGGTMVETWISRGAFEKSDEFKSMIASAPSTGIEAFAGQRAKATLLTIDSLQGSLDTAQGTASWKTTGFDDSHWPSMTLPGLWEQQHLGLDDLDGMVWFRKTIDISAEDAGKAAVLDLGKIDDADESYVNGVRIGKTNGYNEDRHYIIPAGILKPGKNIIAVRVEDTGGGGGIYGKEESIQLVIGTKAIPLAGKWLFRVESVATASSKLGPNSYPTLLFNTMIKPLIPYAFKGVIWYQGETNAGRAYQYRKSFPLMIEDWRANWGNNAFPFLFVQLASFNAGNGDSQHGSTWAELREAQTKTLALANTGMAVTTDIGNATDIHPKNKQEVGRRLALIALAKVYGQTLEYSGPVYQSMETKGNKVIVTFKNKGGGLMTKDKYGYISGFELAGADKQFHYAKAAIENGQLVVWQDDVANPVAVRYAWSDFAGDANLINNEGLPAVPFRTDDWKGITEGSKYMVGN